MYWDANNLYGRAMSQKLPVDNLEWGETHQTLMRVLIIIIKNYNNNSDKGYIFEVDVEDDKELQNKHNDLPFLPEIRKIKKFQTTFICSFYDKAKYFVHIRNLKQALNHGLILKKVHRIIKFNQKACSKSYTKLRTEAKMILKKTSLSL